MNAIQEKINPMLFDPILNTPDTCFRPQVPKPGPGVPPCPTLFYQANFILTHKWLNILQEYTTFFILCHNTLFALLV